MGFIEKTVYVKRCGDKSVMVIFNGDWEVYYGKFPEHPYKYAFGVSGDTPLNVVNMLAEGNIGNYADLFRP
jgi:hypothetical protein